MARPVQKRITPARARGRLAARHSEALLRVVAVETARLRDRLVQLLAEARAARQERRPTLEQYVDPQLTRKVWEGLLRFHGAGARQSERGVVPKRGSVGAPRESDKPVRCS